MVSAPVGTGDEPVTIGLVAHFDFCPRRAWLEAAGERVDSYQMEIGVARHKPADDPTAIRRDVLRALDVGHPEWGYTGRCDSVEILPDGSFRIVEYKATPVRRRAEVTEPMRTQLALQSAALTAMGETVTGCVVYFTEHRRRVSVDLGEDDYERARSLVDATKRCLSANAAPPVLEDDPRCTRCSHAELCMPDERALVPVRRRIIVDDPDSQVLHLATPGSRASVRQGRVLVTKDHAEIASFPLERVQGVAVHGNVDLTGGLIRELLWRDISVVWCTSTGRVVGYATSSSSPNGGARAAQYAAAATGRLDLAREFVSAKLTNQATMLRRNGDGTAVPELRRLAREATAAGSVLQLFGIEGDGASLYFANFPSMLRTGGPHFDTRTRRPALDPVNAGLNYAYALLLGDCIRAVRACGLDPHAGFLHSSGRNKPALALDLAEEFRAPLADSSVIRAFNNGELNESDFDDRLGAVSLTERGRKRLISAYEQRVASVFTHPTFEYKVTWRRAIEIQARLVLGVLDGTQDSYVGVRTR